MDIRKNYINKIDEIPNTSFNKDQKELAKNILNIVDEKSLDNTYKLLVQRVKTGFVFDSAPSTNNQSIAILKYNEKLSLNNLSKSLFDENGLTNDNLLIIGENYDALKNLLLTHKNKINIIYIDPPYNTDASIKEKNNLSEEEIKEKSSTKFVYRDKFSRTGWLNMMQDRLYLAKDLLSDDGVIFVSIDDNEQAYLKVLMDEIFREENFISNLIWRKKNTGGGSDKKTIETETEFIIAYGKNKDLIKFNGMEIDFEKFTLEDQYVNERGKYSLTDLDHVSSASSFQYIESLDYEIKAPDGTMFKNYRNILKPKSYCYTLGKELFDFYNANDFIEIKKTKEGYWKAYRKSYALVTIDRKLKKIIKRESGNSYNNLIDNSSWTTSSGKRMLIKILDNKDFSFPKPHHLIKHLLKIINKKDSIVLDFFAGSGTTAQAVMELNEEDGGNRKFILVTNNSEISDTNKHIATDVTYERLHRIIKGVGTKGEKDFAWITERKGNPYKTNNLKVFDIDYKSITIHDDFNPILNQIKENERMIDENFNIDEESIVYKLTSLHPLKSEDNE